MWRLPRREPLRLPAITRWSAVPLPAPLCRNPACRIIRFLLGRLAVDQAQQGMGLGRLLLLDALRRALRMSEGIGLFAVEVVALDEAARAFYEKYGFLSLQDDALHLYLSMKTVRRMNLPA